MGMNKKVLKYAILNLYKFFQYVSYVTLQLVHGLLLLT